MTLTVTAGFCVIFIFIRSFSEQSPGCDRELGYGENLFLFEHMINHLNMSETSRQNEPVGESSSSRRRVLIDDHEVPRDIPQLVTTTN
jgi:hypothetical protein